MQRKQGLSQLDKKILGALLIALILVVLAASLSYFLSNQPNQITNTPSPTSTPTSNPTPTPTHTSLPVARVTAILNVTQNSYGQLLINGTVTNNSPNEAYDVGLEAFASASIYMVGYQVTVIDMRVPIASGDYAMGTDYTLTTLQSYESVPIDIRILPYYQSQTPNLKDAKVTLVWSNAP